MIAAAVFLFIQFTKYTFIAPDSFNPIMQSTPQQERGTENGTGYKVDLGNLNTRLATIVDRNNSIQDEAARLRDQLKNTTEMHSKEVM